MAVADAKSAITELGRGDAANIIGGTAVFVQLHVGRLVVERTAAFDVDAPVQVKHPVLVILAAEILKTGDIGIGADVQSMPAPVTAQTGPGPHMNDGVADLLVLEVEDVVIVFPRDFDPGSQGKTAHTYTPRLEIGRLAVNGYLQQTRIVILLRHCNTG